MRRCCCPWLYQQVAVCCMRKQFASSEWNLVVKPHQYNMVSEGKADEKCGAVSTPTEFESARQSCWKLEKLSMLSSSAVLATLRRSPRSCNVQRSFTSQGEEMIKVYNIFDFEDDRRDKIDLLHRKFQDGWEARKELPYTWHMFFTWALNQSAAIHWCTYHGLSQILKIKQRLWIWSVNSMRHNPKPSDC